MFTLEFIEYSSRKPGYALFEMCARFSLAAGDKIESVIINSRRLDQTLILDDLLLGDNIISLNCLLPAKAEYVYDLTFRTFHGAKFRDEAITGHFPTPFLEIK